LLSIGLAACSHDAYAEQVNVVSWNAVRAVVFRPPLWGAALGATVALARRDWWRRAPFLPLPEEEFIRWRVATAYGSDEQKIAPNDLVSYLEWRKRQRS
jgi:hypothetical protein